MSWEVVERMTIYRQEGMYALCPNVVRTPSGDLLMFFQRAPHLGYPHHANPLFNLQACRSRDEGRTWSEATLIAANPLGGIMDRGVHTLSDGSIYIHCSSRELVPAEGSEMHGAEWVSRPGKPFWVRSRDDGLTWTAPVLFPPVPDANYGHLADHSGVCRSGLIELPDGRLLMPGKATDRPESEHKYFGMLWVSRDMGESWEYGGRIAEDPVAHFSEPAIHRTPSGRLLVLFRCHSNQPQDEILPLRDRLYNSRFQALVSSDDDGETWTPWQRSVHGYPAHMLGLRDGRIFLTVGIRWEGQSGCLARVLDPEGTELGTGPIRETTPDLENGPDVVVQGDSCSYDCGYPWSVELDDGRVLVVYWHHYPDDHRGIEGAILAEN